MKTEEIISIYCLCSDFCKYLKINNYRLSKMANCEILAVGLISTQYFGGNIRLTRNFCIYSKIFTNVISREEITRRLLKFPDALWICLFEILFQSAKQQCRNESIVFQFLFVIHAEVNFAKLQQEQNI